jgi:hypothetical protein
MIDGLGIKKSHGSHGIDGDFPWGFHDDLKWLPSGKLT